MREIVIDTETTGLDPLGGDRVVEIAVMTLAELQTTADEVSPDHDHHNGNGVRGDRIDNVWGESGHGRSAPLQPRAALAE
jgi:DNA polymerase III epsilon subunit-like protein